MITDNTVLPTSESIAAILSQLRKVRRCGSGWSACCPAHDDRNPSLSVWEESDGQLRFKCYTGCSPQSIRSELGLGGHQRRLVVDHHVRDVTAVDDARKRTEYARRIWQQTKPAAGTLVEKYLRGRGIMIDIPRSIRCGTIRHPEGAYMPGMVAGVEHVQNGSEIIAIHRTWLASDGLDKANLEKNKAFLGPIRGGAVRLAPAGEVLALAEGIETALSVQQATGIPTWAALTTSNLPHVELPECVNDVIICADADPPGEKAARRAAEHFLLAGRKVRIARPRGVNDFNDRLRA